MIELEYWQLLFFPLFFVLGWAAARIDIRHVIKDSRSLPKAYFQGLNFLLNEQQDRAVEAFVDAVKVDDQTVELHFALGGLFRRRGETERAIRLHQTLLARDDLSAELRQQASLELGIDYLKAGLLDRAEAIFGELIPTALSEEAKRNLLEIAQTEKDWLKAVEISSQLSDVASSKQIAQFYCELASAEIIQSNSGAAQEHLNLALSHHRGCVRANILLGDIALKSGGAEQALVQWLRVEQQNPAYLALVAGRVVDAYRALDKLPECMVLLKGFLEHYPSVDMLDAVFQLVLQQEGVDSAIELLRNELKKTPTLLGLDKLVEARSLIVAPENRADLILAKDIIQSYTKRLARYRCDCCGFKARQFYWRCPACGGWETYSPKRAEEFDLSL